MANVWQVLLVASPAMLERMSLAEMMRSFGCSITVAPDFGRLQQADHCWNLLLVELDAFSETELLASLQTAAANGAFEHLILFGARLQVELEPILQCGLSQYIPVGKSLEVLYTALSQHFIAQGRIRELSSQLREASDIALLSMSASSQLGEIIRFLEQSYTCRTCEELGNLLNLTLERLGVAGCGLIQTDQRVHYFGVDERRDAWQRLMQEMRDKGRFVDIENRTITNFDSISVMARNMPEPGSEPYGRMKDMLFTLVEGAEARVRTLALEQAVTLSEKAKSTFLSLMSHELRTPMNAISGFSNRLASKKEGDILTAREVSALQMMRESAERMMEMIEDLQDLCSINVDSSDARNRVLVEDVLADVFRLAQQKAEQKGVAFSRRYSEASLQADLDPARLQQIVKKLCLNAVKYTDSGLISAQVSTRYRRERGEELVIEISDTGKGIPPDRISYLFQPFTHFFKDISHHQQGTGLGLTVVKEFVSEMGGQVEVESVEGKGSLFRICVPQFVQHTQSDFVELF